MKLAISSCHLEHYDCLQKSVGAFLQYMQLTYGMLTIDAWGFLFQKKENNSYQLYTNKGDTIENLKQYYGYALHEIMKTDEIADSIRNGVPVLACLNRNMINWEIDNIINLDDHYVLIIGIDQENMFFVCCDSDAKEENVIIPYQNRGILKKMWTFQKAGNPLTVDEGMLNVAIHKIQNTELERNLVEFSTYIKDHIDEYLSEISYEKDNYHQSDITWQLYNIRTGRIQFIRFLEEVNWVTNRPEIRQLIMELNDVADAWNKFWYYSIKMKCKYTEKNLQRLYTIMNHILASENQAIKTIKILSKSD